MKYQVLLTGIILLLCISFSSISCSFAVEEVKIGQIKQVTWRDNNRVLIIDEKENRYRLLELSTDTQQIFPVYNGNFENSEFISFNSKGNVIAIFDYTNRILKVVENNKLVFISKDLNGVIFHPIKINAQNKDYLVFYLRKIFVVGNFVIIGLGRSYLDTWDPLPKGSVDIVVNWRTNKIFPHYFDLDDPDKANNWKAVYNGNYVDISDDTIYYNSFKSGLFQYFPETNTFSKIFEDNLNIYGIKKSKNLFVLADYKSESIDTHRFPDKSRQRCLFINNGGKLQLLDRICQKRIINFDVSDNFIVLTAYCNLQDGKTQYEVLLYDRQCNLLTQVKIGTAVDRLYEIMPYISPDQNNIVVLPSYQSNESFFMKPEFINISKYKKR